MRLDGAINIAVRRLPLVIALLALCVGSSRADFIDGLVAYDGGDYETVLAEWRPLAEAGDPEAQVALAGLYLTGTGVAADPGEAARWFHLAAAQGNPVAQLNLGDLYSRGLGVPRDFVKAYVWLSLAAAQGRNWPEMRRKEIAVLMSADEVAEAERRVRAWRPAE